jgi:hypothetical protein
LNSLLRETNSGQNYHLDICIGIPSTTSNITRVNIKTITSDYVPARGDTMINAVNGHDFPKADATPVEDERNVTFLF